MAAPPKATASASTLSSSAASSSTWPGRTGARSSIVAARPATGRRSKLSATMADQAANWPIDSATNEDGKESRSAGMAYWPVIRMPAWTEVMRLTKENAREFSCMPVLGGGTGCGGGALLPDYNLAECFSSEQTRDIGHFQR